MSEVVSVDASEGTNVTFVGGKAIEQTEAQESNLPQDEREAAKAAVKKAISEAAKATGEEAAETAKAQRKANPWRPDGAETTERGPDGKFLPKEAKAEAKPEAEPEEDLDLDKASVKQIIKAREKVAQIKREAKDESSKARQEIESSRAQLNQFYQQLEHQKAQLARETQRLQGLRSNPAQALREMGIDPQQYILDLAQDGTPEGEQKRQFKAIQDQIEEMKAWKQEQANHFQRQQQEQQLQYHKQVRQNAVGTFLKLGLDEEKYPHVSQFYGGRQKALVAEGDLISEEYRNLTGKEGSYEEILDYIEDELADRAKSWYSKTYGKAQKVSADTTPPKTQVKSAKGKSLNPEASGERRTLSPKDLRDLDSDERLEAAKQAVKQALASSKD